MRYLRVWERGNTQGGIVDEYIGVLIGVVADNENGTSLVVVSPGGEVTHVDAIKAKVEYPVEDLPYIRKKGRK